MSPQPTATAPRRRFYGTPLIVVLWILYGFGVAPSFYSWGFFVPEVMKDLGIQVLAEGIETEEERAACEEIGCELAQGFLFGRPARIDELQPTLP